MVTREKHHRPQTSASISPGSGGDPPDLQILRALREGELRFGGVTIPCYVLPDGTPLITTRGILAILAGAEHGRLRRYIDRIPENHRHFSLEPIRFRLPDNNALAEGYSAETLTAICRAYTEAFWAGDLRADQRDLAARANIVLAAVSDAGITALVWEATGYDQIKRAGALQDKLALALRAEAGRWAILFTHEFFVALARLHRLPLAGDGKRPLCFAAFLAEYFYGWFDEDVYAELLERNPRGRNGHRRRRHHQFFTDYSRTRFQQHQRDVLVLMETSQNLPEFRMRFNALFRGGGLQYSFPGIN